MSPDKSSQLEASAVTNVQSAKRQARLVMEAIAVLHARGYGLLKLYCYVKEGLGQWRHWIFASDAFPDSIGRWPGVSAHGSIPSWSLFDGSTAHQVADSMLAHAQEVLEVARGQDDVYVNWYREMLLAYPDEVLVMESPRRAEILGRGKIQLPQLKEWIAPIPSPEEIKAWEEASRQGMMQRARERRARRNQRRS